MSGELWRGASAAPVWLQEPLLQPGEAVVVWVGPRDGRLLGWIRRQVELLKARRMDGLLVVASLAAVALFALAGKGLGLLFGGAWFTVGLTVGIGLAVTTIGVFIYIEQGTYHVLTDRRWLVIRGSQVVQAIDIDLIRRLLAAYDAIRATAVPSEEHVLDPSKVRPLLAPACQGIAEIESTLHKLRAFGQLQAPAKT